MSPGLIGSVWAGKAPPKAVPEFKAGLYIAFKSSGFSTVPKLGLPPCAAFKPCAPLLAEDEGRVGV